MSEDRSHQKCWTGSEYVHVCVVPSGRTCLDCSEPAGTLWGPYYCPTHDVARLDRISKSFDDILSGRWAQ